MSFLRVIKTNIRTNMLGMIKKTNISEINLKTSNIAEKH
jgi:hypothetical protein